MERATGAASLPSPSSSCALSPHLACCSFPKGQVVVCAFHRPVKLDPASLSLWARIVLSHPSAILWIISYESYALQNLVRELDSRSLAGRCCSHCK